MNRIGVLKAELTGDPLNRGYAAMTTEERMTSLNTVDRSTSRPSMTGDAVFAATVGSEFGALSDAKKSQWLAFCGRQEIDPFGVANVAFVTYIFGAGSATVTALAAERMQTVSRAQELGLGKVRFGEVAFAGAQ